jgi:hypothetical protein
MAVKMTADEPTMKRRRSMWEIPPLRMTALTLARDAAPGPWHPWLPHWQSRIPGKCALRWTLYACAPPDIGVQHCSPGGCGTREHAWRSCGAWRMQPDVTEEGPRLRTRARWQGCSLSHTDWSFVGGGVLWPIRANFAPTRPIPSIASDADSGAGGH